jgi:hypothetical protein
MTDRTTIVVSIGRDLGPTPIPAPQWETFIEHVTFVVSSLNGNVVGRARGRGEWDGGSEDNYVLIALFPTALLPVLRSQLRVAAGNFGQEAIGLVVHNDGDNSLVEAS